jgi:Tfp pilus assembly protein PilF
MSDSVSERYKEALRNGHLAVVNGRPREALEHYDEASRLVPQRALPLVSKGGVLLQVRRPLEALVCFEEALLRDPQDPGALRGKLQALETSGRRREAAALAALLSDAAAAEERRHGPGAQGMSERRFAEAMAAQGMGDGARALEGYLGAARDYLSANALDAALDACHRALELSAGSPEVHLVMATVYLRRGWRTLAVERLALLDHVLPLTEDPRARAALAGMLREHRARHPELAPVPAS